MKRFYHTVVKTLPINWQNKTTAYVAGLIILLVSQAACTANSLPPYEAEYTTKMRGVRINSDRKFEQIGKDTYQLSWSAKALWMRISERSEFKIINNKVIPIAYYYKRKGLGSDKPISVAFNWDEQKAQGAKGKKSYAFDLAPQTLDRLNFQVQMQLDLLKAPNQESFSYKVANYNGLRDYNFSLEKSETLPSKLGTYNTLVFKRDKKDYSIRLWMSPEHHYLPLKVQQSGDDANTVVIKGWKSDKETYAALLESGPQTNIQADKQVVGTAYGNAEQNNSYLNTVEQPIIDDQDF